MGGSVRCIAWHLGWVWPRLIPKVLAQSEDNIDKNTICYTMKVLSTKVSAQYSPCRSDHLLYQSAVLAQSSPGFASPSSTSLLIAESPGLFPTGAMALSSRCPSSPLVSTTNLRPSCPTSALPAPTPRLPPLPDWLLLSATNAPLLSPEPPRTPKSRCRPETGTLFAPVCCGPPPSHQRVVFCASV